MRVKLFTHTDLDGVGCGVVAKLAFGYDVDITYCGYNNINEEVKKYLEEEPINGEIHITDISVNEEVAELLDKAKVPVKLFDHHKTALWLNKYEWAKVDEYINEIKSMKTSGTQLYFDYLNNQKCFIGKMMRLYVFVDLVRDYDTWRWKELGSDGILNKQLNDLFGLYGRNKFIDWAINKIEYDGWIKLDPEDKLVLEINQQQIDDYIEQKNKQMFQINLYGRYGGVVYADRYFSEMGNRLAELHPEYDFIAMIDVGGGMVSYRTVKDDIDLGELAKKFGGGGHPKAAGSRFDPTVCGVINDAVFRANEEEPEPAAVILRSLMRF